MRKLVDVSVLVLLVSAASLAVACSPNAAEETAPTDDAPVATKKDDGAGDDDDDNDNDNDNDKEKPGASSGGGPAASNDDAGPSGSSPSGSTPPPADPTTPAPPAPTASPECLADSVAETEANDTADTANSVPGASGSFCGTISADSDVDFFTFTAPANAQGLSFSAAYSKKGATVEVAVDGGAAVQLGTGALKLVPGGRYVVKVSGVASLAYRVNVALK